MYLKYLTVFLSAILISGCHPSEKDGEQKLTGHVVNKDVKISLADAKRSNKESQTDDAEEWLKSIFKTKDSDKYFPDYNVEERLCTKRFYAFILDSGELYGPSNMTDEEYPIMEKKYKEKWSNIYPIEEREMWLFGRGNGDIGELKKLAVSKLKDNVYRVFIDYGNNIKTENEVTVVKENVNFKIDYCKTKFLN